jgi:hypothetical protein
MRNVTRDARPRISCCHRKAVSIRYSESVFVTLGTHHAQQMRRTILASEAYPLLSNFPHIIS